MSLLKGKQGFFTTTKTATTTTTTPMLAVYLQNLCLATIKMKVSKLEHGSYLQGTVQDLPPTASEDTTHTHTKCHR